MNKILVYTVVAILLGTVTMVVPLTLFRANEPIPGTYTIRVNDTEANKQANDPVNGETLGSTDMWTRPEAANTPLEPAPTEMTVNMGNVSYLSPIALMTVPSFLVALVFFVYLKKRVS